jgi:hypothetical protein
MLNESRVAEQVRAWRAGRTGNVLVWLQQLGCRILSRPELGTTWHLRGIAGSNATLGRDDDPRDIAVALGMLIAGMFWPDVFPALLTLVRAPRKGTDGNSIVD